MKRNVSNPQDIKRKDLKGLSLSEWDRKNLEYLIEFYRKAFPGVIEEVVATARAETQAVARQKSWKADELNFNRRMAIPNGLWQRIKEGYPSIMVDTKQFEQFLKWFKEFDLKR